MNMKRQRGRNNGRNKPHMLIRAQTFDSAGPDVRIRGNAYQVLEKYLAMARDATAAGDRIAAENFYQHAEHYYRLINAGNDGHHRPQMQGGQQPPPQQYQPGTQPQNPNQPHDPRSGGQDQPHDSGAGPQPLMGPASNYGNNPGDNQTN